MNKLGLKLGCKYVFPCKGNVYNFTAAWEAIFSPAWSDFDRRGETSPNNLGKVEQVVS